MLGRLIEAVIPGPGSRFHKDNWFWNFLNPGPFSTSGRKFSSMHFF